MLKAWKAEVRCKPTTSYRLASLTGCSWHCWHCWHCWNCCFCCFCCLCWHCWQCWHDFFHNMFQQHKRITSLHFNLLNTPYSAPAATVTHYRQSGETCKACLLCPIPHPQRQRHCNGHVRNTSTRYERIILAFEHVYWDEACCGCRESNFPHFHTETASSVDSFSQA
jgi:hypothetical protein